MNNMNKSDVTTQGTSQTVEDTQSKIMSTVETTANETSDVTPTTSFKTTVNSDKTVHDMKDLMARPTLLETGKITSAGSSMVYSYDADTFAAMKTGPIPGYLCSFAFPQSLTRSNPVVAAKIKQFTFMKADIKFELKVNCPPNVSGALLVVYMPIGDDINLDGTNLTVQGLTSCPCKILDYSADTSLTMTVPYINQYDYYNRQQAVINGDSKQNLPRAYGKIFVFNLQKPLSSSTADFVSYTALASLENVELSLPSADRLPNRIYTDDAYYAQSGGMVQRIPGRDIMSSAGYSSDIRLSYSTIAPKGDVITYDKNEMDLSYVLKRENIIGQVTYSKGRDAENSSYLGKVRCFPKRVRVSGGYNATTGWTGAPEKLASQMGTFDYVSNLFGRYTGTVKIGLRLIKTKFHYGRFAVIFDPFNKLDDAPANLQAQLSTLLSTNYSIVIDLNGNDGEEGGSNYYSIEVPYINNAGFSLIGNDSIENPLSKNVLLHHFEQDDVPNTCVSRECYNPFLRFYALTELGYLSSAADEVPILLSISAGDDYELSVPRVNVRLADPPAIADPYYAQSSLTLVPMTKSSSNSNTTHCNGETISSLKEIANRFTAPTIPVGTSIGYYRNETSNNNIPVGYVLSLHQNTPYGLKMSNYEAVAALYRFAYGGRRYKVSANGPAWIMARLLHVPASLGKLGEDATGLIRSARISPSASCAVPLSGEMIVESNVNNMLEIERPFYSNRKLISNIDQDTPSRGQCSDEVVTQLLAISKDPDQTTNLDFGTSGLSCTIGPSFVDRGDGVNCKQVIPNNHKYDPSGSKTLGIRVCPLSFTEREVLLETTGSSKKVRYRNFVTGPVLEALGSGAGCTFLQAPPCVIFG